MNLAIPQLNLNPTALTAAHELYRECPWVIFTSGKRTVIQQAYAMATMVVLRRDFLARTYIHGGEDLQLVVNRNPQWITVEQIGHGLYAHLQTMPVESLAALSRHMTGDAFDVLPLIGATPKEQAQAQDTIRVIQRLPGLDHFLTKEAGIPRWHLQFVKSMPVVVAETHQV